jgi:hypothetical protein
MNDSTVQQDMIEWLTVAIIRANRRPDLCTVENVEKIRKIADQMKADKPAVMNVPTRAEAEESPKPASPLAAAAQAKALAAKIKAAKAEKAAIPDAEPETDKRQAFFNSMIAELEAHDDYLTVTCIPERTKAGKEVYSLAWRWGEGKHQSQFVYLFDKPAEALGAWLLTGPEIAGCLYLNKNGYVAVRQADFLTYCTNDRDATFNE